MDLSLNQIKLASCTHPVLFDFHGHMMEVVVLEIKNKIVSTEYVQNLLMYFWLFQIE